MPRGAKSGQRLAPSRPYMASKLGDTAWLLRERLGASASAARCPSRQPPGVCVGKPGRGLLQFWDSRGRPQAVMRPIMAENNKRKPVTWILIAVLAIAVLAVLALRRQAPVVNVVRVTREDLSATITSNGKVEPISPTVARAEFPAFVDKVLATEGQAVRRGQGILTMNASDVRSQLAQSRADLLSAQNDLRNARAGGPPDQVAQLDGDIGTAGLQVKNLETSEQALEGLVAKHAATQDELAQAQESLAKARANLQALQAKKQDLTLRNAAIVQGAELRVSQAQAPEQSLGAKA